MTKNNYWQTKTLGKVCDFQNGFAFKSKLFKEKGFPVLRISNIQNDGISYRRLVFFDKESYKENFDRYQVTKGDLVIAMSGATTGKLAISNVDETFYLNQRVGKFIPKKNLSKDYLYYFLSTRIEENLRISSGAAQPNLSTGQIKNFKIPLPPFPKQKQIVGILDKVFEGIAKAKENAEKNLQNAKEFFESYLQNVFANPGDGWEEKRLGEVLQKTETIDPTKTPDKEFIYIDVSSVNKENFTIENTTLMKGKNAPSRARKFVKANDVIFATVRPTLRRIAIIPKKYDGQVCSTGYFVLRTKEYLNNNLVFYFLQTSNFNKKMEELQKGASYPAVTDGDVREQIIPFPKSIAEQKAIVKKLDELSAQTKKLEEIYLKKLADLDELRKSVLKKAFSGNL